MHRKVVKALFAISAILGVSTDIAAQSFLGLSANYGDKLAFSPDYSGLLKRSSPSVTLVFTQQKRMINNLSLMFGGQAGFAGYQIAVKVPDTLGYANEKNGFGDFGIVTGKFEVTPGLTFMIKNRDLFVGIGGGISYYKVIYETATYGVGVVSNGNLYKTFFADVEAPRSGTLLGFVKLYVKRPVSDRLQLAVQYSTHFKSILAGDFQFYHTKTPASGTISLIPRGISLQILYRLRKKTT